VIVIPDTVPSRPDNTFYPGELVRWKKLWTHKPLKDSEDIGIIIEYVPPYVKTLEPLGGYEIFFAAAGEEDGEIMIACPTDIELLSSN
jgi:hypothetical protein